MPYQQGYPQGDYGAYQSYGEPLDHHFYQNNQQAQYPSVQQPMTVFPQQPRPDVSHVGRTLHELPFSQDAGFLQQYQSPVTQQQYYLPQSQPQFYSQGIPQQPAQFLSQQSPQYQGSPQTSFPQQVRQVQPQSQTSAQLQYDQLQRQSVQTQPPNLYQRQSPNLSQGRQPYTQQQRMPAQLGSRLDGQVPQPRPPVHEQSHTQTVSYSTPQPTPQRVAARIEIPVHRSNTAMAPAPKRRGSVERQAIPVSVREVPVAVRRTSQQQPKQPPMSSSPLTELTSSQMPPTPQPHVDYQAVMLSLAEEYTGAAYALSTGLSTSNATDGMREQYYRLMSMAMGCLDCLLNNYREPDPRKEARIRLRLASLLIEETENDEGAEEVLAKGILLCERSRLLDLKYAMHHVLARLTFASSPKAALKAIDKLVQETEALNLAHWTYTFHFLRVSLSLEMDGHSDTAGILKHLAAMTAMAEQQRHVAVQIIAAVFEAIVYIRSSLPDAVELVQRAMTSARAHQLSPTMQAMPQVQALLDYLDLACCLVQPNAAQVAAKLKQMQDNLDSRIRDARWRKDGSVFVELLVVANESLEQDTCGIMRRDSDGHALLVLQWIPSSQLYSLGYLLSGFTQLYKNNGDGKAEEFLNESLKLADLAPTKITQSLAAATESADRQASLRIAVQLHLIYATCARYDWAAARSIVQDVRKRYATHALEIDEATGRTLLYLEAVCWQGMGELQTAVELYSSQSLTFDPESKASPAEKDVRALATLNSIFILRSEDPIKADKLLTNVEDYCLAHANNALFAAYYIIKATSQTSNAAIIKTKQYLQHAVQASKTASNNQLLCIVMNVLTTTFFTNIVGDQAEKSAKAGRSLARKSGDNLWTIVADGIYGDVMERCGKGAEAEAARREAQSLAADLPEVLRDALQVDGA